MANAVTARPPGTDAIHFNPAGLARIKNELTQYKLQLAYTAFEGSVSGRAPGEPFDAIEDDQYSQDPLLQGQQSRPIEVSSSNIYLPIFGHVELPFVIAPGYGFALRSSNNQFVFANSAVMVAAGGFRRDSDNVAAYAGEKVGQTTLAYFNPHRGVSTHRQHRCGHVDWFFLGWLGAHHTGTIGGAFISGNKWPGGCH